MTQIRTKKQRLDKILYETTSLGGRRQMELLPKVLRLMRGPAGTLLTGLFHTLQRVPMDQVMALTRGLSSEDLMAHPERLAELVQLIPATTIDRDHVSVTLAELAEDLDAVGGPAFFDALFEKTIIIDDSGTRRPMEDAFDEHFDGQLGRVLKLTAWVVEFNFAPFLRSSLPGLAPVPTTSSDASSPASSGGERAPT